MKSIINYYLLIFLPMITIAILTTKHLINSSTFVGLLLIYALIYHPLISGLRLIAWNKITKQQLWYSFVPGGIGNIFLSCFLMLKVKYFKLYFKNVILNSLTGKKKENFNAYPLFGYSQPRRRL